MLFFYLSISLLLSHLPVCITLSTSEQNVAEQYETFPYPFVHGVGTFTYADVNEPETYFGLSLFELNHFLWGGRRNFQHTGLNVLIAGGGTSKMSTVLAQTLEENNVPGIIVHLDLSNASISLAREKAIAFGVSHRIQFIQGSLLNVNQDLTVMQHAPEGFDLVVSTGVIHHLESPALGLETLGKALAKGGGLFIMVYGKYGRNGIYPLQEAFRKLMPLHNSNLHNRLNITKQLVQLLPATHPFIVGNPNTYFSEVELYDLLLHSQDTPFTVPSVLEMAKQANVKIVDFVYNAQYNPTNFLNPTIHLYEMENIMKNLFENMTRFEKYEIGEKLSHSISNHYFYAVREKEDINPAGLHLDSISLKAASLCRPKGSLLLESINSEYRETFQKRLAKEGMTGWTELFRIYDDGKRVYHYHLPPLSGEIAAATLISEDVNRKRCAKVSNIFSAVNKQVYGFDIDWNDFEIQLRELILIGESLMHLLVAYESSFVPTIHQEM